MRILVTGVLLTGVLCCYAVPDGEKFKEEVKISSHHEQQLGYPHQTQDTNQRGHRSFQHQSPQIHRLHPTQISSQPSREEQHSNIKKSDLNEHQNQRQHYKRKNQTEHQPQQYQQHPKHQQQQHNQQPQQRKQWHRQLPSPPPSPHHRQLPPPPLPPYRRQNRPSQSPDRNLDNAQQTKVVQTIPGNGEPLRSGESDSFNRNGSRPISVEDILQRLPHRYDINDQHNVKTFHNNDVSSRQKDLPFKEPYLLGESAETTNDEIDEIHEKEPTTSDKQNIEPYFFEGDYHDESPLSREGSVSVYAYTESSVLPDSTSTLNYPEPMLFVETDAKRFESNQPDITPNVGHVHLRRQLQNIARRRNTSSIQRKENADGVEETYYNNENDHHVHEEKGRGDDPSQGAATHHNPESDEYSEVFENLPNIPKTYEPSQVVGGDPTHRSENLHPRRILKINDGQQPSLSVSSLDLDRRLRSRHLNGQRRFQRPPQQNDDHRSRDRKPHISMSKQLARYSDTRSIVSPLFNSTFNRDELHANNSGVSDFIDLTKSEPTLRTRPTFHIKSDSIVDFTAKDGGKENPSDSIVDEIVEYSKSSEGISDLEEGFAGPENPPGRKYSYSYVNHYIAPTPKAYRTTETPSLESDSDVQITSPITNVEEVIGTLAIEDSAYQSPNETHNDSVVGEYSDTFATIIKKSVSTEEATHLEIQAETTTTSSTTTTTTTTSTTTPETTTTTTTPATTTLSTPPIVTERNSPFSLLVDRASGTIITTDNPNPHALLTSTLQASESHETTTPSTPAFVTPETLLEPLPPNPFANLAGLSTNFSITNWNPGSGLPTNLNTHNPFSYRFPQSQSFQSNDQSQSSPLGSSGSNLFGLSNLLGLGTLSGLQGFGQSTPPQPGTANLGFTSAPISHHASSANTHSGQQGGSSLDLGGLGYLSLLTAGLGGLNLSPQPDLSNLPSLASGGAQQGQPFNNPFQQVTSEGGSGQPDNSFVQLVLKQLGGGGGVGSPANQNPFGYSPSLGQNPFAIHPQALTLGAASPAPSLLPASFGAGSVQPVVAAPEAASSGSGSGNIDSVAPEGT